MLLPDWPRAHGLPLFAATIRNRCEDFDVTEKLGVEFSGDGEHDLVHVCKTGSNTEWVARQLAGFAGVSAKDVGFSGLKDRHAVTRQWFSVPRWNNPDWGTFETDGIEIVEIERHSRKLRRGTHKANSFRIVLRGQPQDPTTVQRRLERIEKEGVPNYFGEQRFGRGGSNLELANRWSNGDRMPRHKRSMAISAARSYLFNQVLAVRVTDETWNEMLPGNAANLDGTGSVFAVDTVDDDINSRCREMDIHPTGLLWGDGVPKSAVPPGHENWLEALSEARMKPLYRSLRARVRDLSWDIADDTVTLDFKLGKGAYATSVLREIADVTDAVAQ